MMKTLIIFLMSIAAVIFMSTAAVAQEQITFTKNVAPILQDHCQVCHREGTIAPMALLTYEQVRPWAKSIKAKVTAREMPPWYMEKNVGVQNFDNDVSLSDKDIETITKWVDNGAPQGNTADMPKPREFPDEHAWQIGQPDLIVSLNKKLLVPTPVPTPYQRHRGTGRRSRCVAGHHRRSEAHREPLHQGDSDYSDEGVHEYPPHSHVNGEAQRQQHSWWCG
jgi:hypothetical protein